MNRTRSMPTNRDKVYYPAGLNNLIAERDHYRRRSAILKSVNKLYTRLTATVDLQSMLDAFSDWLMPIVEHCMLLYDNFSRRKRYLLCSAHGTKKLKIRQVAEKILERIMASELTTNVSFYEEQLYVSVWAVGEKQNTSKIVLVGEGGKIPENLVQYIEEGIKVLEKSMQRGFEYEILYEQARHDPLTGLANRRVFDERIGPLLETAKRHKRSISVLSMDLDRFKTINDTMGHAEGDRVLRCVADKLAQHMRASDLLLRMGGDEFLVLLPETNAGSARIMAKRLCEAINGLDIQTPDGLKIGISIGVAQWRFGQSKQDWLLKADEALYQAKKKGRINNICSNIYVA